MTSTAAAEFAPPRGMGSMYEPLYQANIWEDMFRSGDISSPTRGACEVTQPDTRLENKSETTSHEPSSGPFGDGEDVRSLSDKVQRRLAQNREAARKSRLRKKAYIQQLETSRLKLAQLELELERTRHQFQGMYIGGASALPFSSSQMSAGTAIFEMEYWNWTEELERKNAQLRTALQTPMTDIELRILVESVLSHYYELFRMKTEAAKADVFYIVSGMWRTPVEQFFLWIGGFRPSELINIVAPQIGQLTDQQHMDVSNLRHSCQQAEDALTQGMEKLQQTLAQCITIGTINGAGAGSYGSLLVSAMDKLDSLESFSNEADHLRHQTLHHMSRILTTRQSARCLLAFGDYFQRLRALSSLWASRPREPAYSGIL